MERSTTIWSQETQQISLQNLPDYYNSKSKHAPSIRELWLFAHNVLITYMLLTLHSTDLLGSTELQITCDCLHKHYLMQHVRIKHSNQQLLYHQCLHSLWFTQHIQVPCMSQAFNMQRASEEKNEVDTEYYRWHAEMLEDNMQKKISLCIPQQDKEKFISWVISVLGYITDNWHWKGYNEKCNILVSCCAVPITHWYLI